MMPESGLLKGRFGKAGSVGWSGFFDGFLTQFPEAWIEEDKIRQKQNSGMSAEKAQTATMKEMLIPQVFSGAIAGITKSNSKADNHSAQANNNEAQKAQSQKTPVKATCAAPPACFVAGTLIQTVDGLKPIEQIQRGDLVWSRQEFGDAYAYKPVFETKVTESQQLHEIIVENTSGETETYLTTAEHPFYIADLGWLKASLLEAGMPLLDRNGNSGSLKVKSQTKLERWETVYNFEVGDFHTYHVGRLGVWVHNADCCRVDTVYSNIKPTQEFVAGTSIPKSFELTTPSENFWVHPNATKHMVERVTRKGMDPKTQNIRSQAILTSFNSAVNKAVTQGIEYDKMMHVDGWELIFTRGRHGDKLPVIKHALYK